MFGLFDSKQNPQKAYKELLAYLTDSWEMKGRYAVTFLETYRRSISKIYGEVMNRYDAIEHSGDAELQLMTAATGGKNDAMDHILITQAYRGYKDDLRNGKHVGTDAEIAIWAILCNRSDILEQIDKSLARYIDKEQERRFPNLLTKAFRDADFKEENNSRNQTPSVLAATHIGLLEPGQERSIMVIVKGAEYDAKSREIDRVSVSLDVESDVLVNGSVVAPDTVRVVFQNWSGEAIVVPPCTLTLDIRKYHPRPELTWIVPQDGIYSIGGEDIPLKAGDVMSYKHRPVAMKVGDTYQPFSIHIAPDDDYF